MLAMPVGVGDGGYWSIFGLLRLFLRVQSYFPKTLGTVS